MARTQHVAINASFRIRLAGTEDNEGTQRGLTDCDDLWGFYSCRRTKMDREREHAILHLGIDVGRLTMISGRARDVGLQTDLGMWWDMKPTKKVSELSLTL